MHQIAAWRNSNKMVISGARRNVAGVSESGAEILGKEKRYSEFQLKIGIGSLRTSDSRYCGRLREDSHPVPTPSVIFAFLSQVWVGFGCDIYFVNDDGMTMIPRINYQ